MQKLNGYELTTALYFNKKKQEVTLLRFYHHVAPMQGEDDYCCTKCEKVVTDEEPGLLLWLEPDGEDMAVLHSDRRCGGMCSGDWSFLISDECFWFT